MLELLRRMYEYDKWAAQKTVDGLKSVPGGPDERMLGLLAHIQASKLLWLGRMHAADDAQTATWPQLSLEECEQLRCKMEGAYNKLFEGLDDAALARVVHYTTVAGDPAQQSVGDMLTHKMLHAMYHRGQLAQLIRAAGGTPVGQDFVVWTKARRENSGQ
jgi:uncharacterized damage-inducible protein DinB